MKQALVVIGKVVLFLLGGWWFGPTEPDAISKMQTQPKRKPLLICGKCSAEIAFETSACPKCGFLFGSMPA
jgi:hypothetical protein